MAVPTARAAPAGDDTADRTGDDRTRSPVIDVAALLTHGGILYGVPVLSLTVRTADGRTQVLELPAPSATRMAAAAKFSQTARDILEVLEDREGDWVRMSEIALAMPGQPDHTSGTFTRAASELRAADLIESSKQHGYRLKPLES